VGVVSFLIGCLVAVAGYAAYTRRRGNSSEFERQKLRDSLQLIDTKKALEAADANVQRIQKQREDTVADYNRNLWRPGDQPGPRE
jgi:hypothetical protein